eukprot:3940501-Rhodomonas_salina.2
MSGPQKSWQERVAFFAIVVQSMGQGGMCEKEWRVDPLLSTAHCRARIAWEQADQCQGRASDSI